MVSLGEKILVRFYNDNFDHLLLSPALPLEEEKIILNGCGSANVSNFSCVPHVLQKKEHVVK